MGTLTNLQGNHHLKTDINITQQMDFLIDSGLFCFTELV